MLLHSLSRVKKSQFGPYMYIF